MARIRTIKPEFFTSEDIVSLSAFARLLYIALWCEADREGRMVWKPKTFKMRYFPADDIDVQALCDEITSAGLIKLYGEGYAYVPAFHAHQHINPRETTSQLPEPSKDDAKTTRKARVNHASPRDSDVQGGREGKGNIEDASRRFDVFWSAYPRKVAKEDARKAFDKRSPDDELMAEILKAIAKQSSSADWQKDGGKYVPHPATWLNGARWTDEVGQPAEAGELGAFV